MIHKYPLIISTLTAVYGQEPDDSDGSDLEHAMTNLALAPYKAALVVEVNAALQDRDLSWRQILAECRVTDAASEEEAIYLANQLLTDVLAVGQ